MNRHTGKPTVSIAYMYFRNRRRAVWDLDSSVLFVAVFLPRDAL